MKRDVHEHTYFLVSILNHLLCIGCDGRTLYASPSVAVYSDFQSVFAEYSAYHLLCRKVIAPARPQVTVADGRRDRHTSRLGVI